MFFIRILTTLDCPGLCRQHKKNPYGSKYKILSDILTSYFKRSQFCFELDTLTVVEIDVFIYEEASLLIGLKIGAINALCFENRKEIFS